MLGVFPGISMDLKGFPAGLIMTLMTTSPISRCRVVVYVPRINTHAHTTKHTFFLTDTFLYLCKGQQLYCMAQRQKKKRQVSLLFVENTQQIDSGICSPKSRTLSLHYKTFLIHWLVPLLKEDKIKILIVPISVQIGGPAAKTKQDRSIGQPRMFQKFFTHDRTEFK